EETLSFGQRALWLQYRLAPETGVHNVAAAVRVRPAPDATSLRRALSALAMRHAALRTIFDAVGGEPRQKVVKLLEPELVVESAVTWSPAALDRHCRQEAYRPFNLERGPLLRVALFQQSAEAAVVVLAMHHIVSDFWSLAVLSRELGLLYVQETGGPSAVMEPLRSSYAEYVRWEAERLAGAEGELLWRYWRETLAGRLPALDLPLDHSRPQLPSYRGRAETFRLTADLSSALGSLARTRGVTLFAMLLAGYMTLLHRLTGQDDLLVGAPVASRSRSDWTRLIGYFVNIVPLRAAISGDLRFAALVDRLRAVLLAGFAHQPFPFSLLVDRLVPWRDPGRPALVQTLLVMYRGRSREEQALAAIAAGEAGERMQLGGLELESLRLAEQGSQLDLLLKTAEVRGRLCGSLQYDTDLFDAVTVRRMVRQLGNLLAGAVADPAVGLSGLPLLDAAERHAVCVEWSGSPADYPRDSTIHQLFAAQVRQGTDRIALVAGDEQLSYGELDFRSEQVAYHLRAWGVGAEEPVAFCLEQPVAVVVATLAILKAGGAYLPLDPAAPRQRTAAMLEDARLGSRGQLLLTAPPVASMLAWIEEAGWRWVDLAVLTTASRPAPHPAHPAPPATRAEQGLGDLLRAESTDRAAVGSDNLAYVMYTSGSTGRPKGVAVTHRGVVRLILQTAYAHFGDDEVFVQLAPVSFDAATFEIWGALLHGGRLVTMPPGVPSLQQLGQTLARHQVTTLWLTAGWFHQVVEEDVRQLAPVRQLLAGGDVLVPSHVSRVLRELPRTRLINGYGPTEGTTFTCTERVREPLVGSVPIGRPIANSRVYVLDLDLRPVPAGVAGDLWLGGAGLARGYLGAADLTAERFRPDPLAPGGGERLYRTGDRARWLADGRLGFLGRVDRQVKVRGFRIELGEVEAALGRCGEVSEAAVALARDAAGEPCLIAYVVARQSGGVLAGLRGALRELLPEPMVPAAFVTLERLPRNANGKIDYRALTAPVADLAAPGAGYVAPRTPVEELLATIWADLLGRERVGIADDFFDLGGHSLLAVRVAGRIRDLFGVDMTVKDFLNAPTIADLAISIAQKLVDMSDDQEVAEVLAELGREDRPGAARESPQPGTRSSIW
ncbi:MAG TPA: amino acid adenylation domain-containing protein, partial [Thermoanaerobaculia bacterium]|nr:amino acid adenylation domain-containing protein [Thermoanaerobaculia bacterium]